ncbi:hypothetical protein L873DRAFT_1822960 [Choiromyces venosus 120613-1]|uniref:Uncharacterized protein n=1 Tax=Choiromyces venosus 120613-1 TaxID=1336337 RepID=A0A3N4IYG3_9PEZI|nr:hypothetical protein L873DRAFT_1822960 [Choiromyces venosus 120613-1]
MKWLRSTFAHLAVICYVECPIFARNESVKYIVRTSQKAFPVTPVMECQCYHIGKSPISPA